MIEPYPTPKPSPTAKPNPIPCPKPNYVDKIGFVIGFPGQIRKFISQIYFLCIQIRRFWHYGVNLLF